MRVGSILRITILVSLIAGLGLALLSTVAAMGMAVYAEQLVGTAWLIFGMAILALPCGSCFDRGRRRGLMVSGLVTSAICTGGWLLLIWFWPAFGNDGAELMFRVFGSIMTWTGLTALIGMLHLHRTRNPVALWCRRGTIALASLFGVVILFAIWFMESLGWRGEEELGKMLGVLGVSAACATLVTFLVMRFRQLQIVGDDVDEDEVRMDFDLRCPRCGLHQATQTGGANCARCGLRIKVAIP